MGIGGSLHRGKTTIAEPSVCMSYRHRNHGAPCEVARDNMSIYIAMCFFLQFFYSRMLGHENDPSQNTTQVTDGQTDSNASQINMGTGG